MEDVTEPYVWPSTEAPPVMAPCTWCGQITTQLGTPRGRYDKHSCKFSLSKKPRFIKPVGKSQTSEGDVC
jgi:hypothetical protein